MSRISSTPGPSSDGGSSDDGETGDPTIEFFTDLEYPRILKEEMFEILQSSQFSDVEIDCSGQIFKLHRNILSMTCPYFRMMFSSNFKEGSQTKVKLHDIEVDAFTDVLKYLYSGEVGITTNNVVRVAKLADMFELFGLHEYCCKFLTQRIACVNCLGFMKFGRVLNSIKLEKAASRFALQNFKKVVQCEEFLELDKTDLCNYINQPALNVSLEDNVVLSIFRWLEKSPKERIGDFKEVLCSLHLLDVDFSPIRFSMMKIPALRNDPDVMNFLKEIQDHMLYQFPVPKEVEVLCPRLFTNARKGVLFFFEKVSSSARSKSVGGRVSVSPYTIFVDHRDACVLQKRPFTDLLGVSSIKLTPGISCCALSATTLYVSCLGFARNELYRLEVNGSYKWLLYGYVPKARIWHRCVSGPDNKLYIVGGCPPDVDNCPMGEILEFDTGLTSWNTIGELHIPVQKCGAIFTKGDIFVFGGLAKAERGDGKTTVVYQCQKFDTFTKQCTVLETKLPIFNPIIKVFMPRDKVLIMTEQQVISIDLETLYANNGSKTVFQAAFHRLGDKFTGEILGKRLLILTSKGLLRTTPWQRLFENNDVQSVLHFDTHLALCHGSETINCCDAALVSLRANICT